MYCQNVSRSRQRGERTGCTKVCARRGLHDQPNGNRRVERFPSGVCYVNEPRTALGSSMDQKQLDMSSLVKNIGVVDLGSTSDSRDGR